MELTLNPQLGMRQGLSLRLQQSVQILQLSSHEVRELVAESIAENPFLSLQEKPEFPISLTPGHGTRTPADSIQPTEPWQNTPQSRNELLYENIRLSRADEYTKALCQLIIDALDENGYFTATFDELMPEGYRTAKLADWNRALTLVQNLCAPGIGARSPQEALQRQVLARSDIQAEKKQALVSLIEDELHTIACGDIATLKKHPDMQIFDDSCEPIRIVRQLNPKPGLAYDQSVPVNVVPDIHLSAHAGDWYISPNPDSMPTLVVQAHYAEQLAQHKHRALQSLLKQAQNLSASLTMRKHTICRVARAILKHQSLFFELGERALRPLTLQTLADELGLHESTISRATASKYMSTPRGLYSFRYFLSREIKTSFGGVCSSAMVKAKIRALISLEPSDSPFNDLQLHEQLLADNIRISKRAVSKYRLQMGIPNALARLRQERLSKLSQA